MIGAARVFRTALTAVMLATLAPAHAQDELREAVKAAYLYRLAAFVEWPVFFANPAPTLAPPDPFDICVIGEDPFGALLDRTIADQVIRGRPVRALRFDAAPADHGCEIMYIAGSSGHSVREALNRARGEPVLTVTDSAYSPQDAGIVHFVERGGRIGFIIDNALLSESGLTVSSKLLDVAAEVRPAPSAAAERSEK